MNKLHRFVRFDDVVFDGLVFLFASKLPNGVLSSVLISRISLLNDTC